METLSPLFTLVRSFFLVFLPEEQKCSQNTIRSYRKSLELLFDFVKERNSVALNEITFEMMDRNTVSEFLSYLETERNCSISTRNHRLHCIRAFFKYAAQEDITVIAHLEEIQKVKRAKQPETIVEHMSEDAVQAILKQPDTYTEKGKRDAFLLLFLYKTGARVQELVDIRLCDIQLGKYPKVTIHGKGAKTRAIPLRDDVVQHLKKYLALFHPEQNLFSEQYLFYVTRNQNRKRMTEDNVRKLIAKYGVQARKICKEVPENVHAALTNSTPIILILTSVAMGATNGVSILISQAIGAKDKKKAESLIATSFCVAVTFSLLVTILLEIFLPGILKALNTPAETYDMAYSYLAIYILGYLAVYLYLYFTAVLRSFGNSMFQAVAMLVSTILNAVFDPVFIHFIGFHGAAIATLLSQMICLLFMLTYLKKKKLFTFKISAFNCSDVLLLIQKAIPSVIQQSIPAISTTSLTALVSTYSVTAIAAYGVTGKLETILFYPAMALNMVLTTIIGQCAGGARYDRAKDYLKCALGYGCGLLVILSVLVVGFSKQLSGLFVRSSDVAVIVGTYFLIVSIGYVLNTVTNCYLGALNGMGKPSISMFLMIFYYIVVRMPLAYLLSYLGFGLNGIWVAVLVSHIVASLAATMTGTVLIRKKGNIKA